VTIAHHSKYEKKIAIVKKKVIPEKSLNHYYGAMTRGCVPSKVKMVI
jgi:hypothetical protein